MTYNVFGGTLNPTLLPSHTISFVCMRTSTVTLRVVMLHIESYRRESAAGILSVIIDSNFCSFITCCDFTFRCFGRLRFSRCQLSAISREPLLLTCSAVFALLLPANPALQISIQSGFWMSPACGGWQGMQ